MTNDNEERQELELSSLKAIYPEIIDLRNEHQRKQQTNRKNNRQASWRPLDILITLRPNSETVYCQLDLHIKCTLKYPHQAPDLIEIKNVVGLSNSSIQKLEDELINLSKELANKDEESLFMCISKVEEFLNQNNKPAPKSFYDQMLSNQLKQQEEEERLRLERINKEKQKEEELSKVIKQAMDEKQKLLENESKQLRRASFMREDDTILSSIISLKTSISTIKERFLNNLSSFKGYQLNEQKSSRVCLQNHHSQTSPSPVSSIVDYCKFKTVTGNELHVQKLSCDLHTDLYIDYITVQKSVNDTSSSFALVPSFYLLSEFQHLKLTASKEEKSKLMKELLNIRTKFESRLVHLNHAHIIQPIAFTYSLENDLLSLKLLNNYLKHNIRFCDLPFVLNNFEQQEIRSSFYFIQILDALNYLHSNHIVHANLNTENIMLDLHSGQIKLLNPMIQSCLYDFIDQLNSRSSNITTINQSSSAIELDFNRDYISFGLLLCWFKFKFNPVDFKQLLLIKQTDLIKMLQDHNCIGSELDLVRNCLNPHTSITALEPILVEYFEQACTNLNEHLKKTTRLIDELESDQVEEKENLKDLTVTSKNSRLSDFEIISKLGEGGFGEVYKVRNNLDHQLYALKKIKINTTNKLLNKKIKQEVRYLSGLCHENVVRYYSSWIEYDFGDKKTNDEVDSLSTQSDDKDYYSEESSDEEIDDLTDARRLFSNSLRLPEISNKDYDLSDSYVVFQDSQDGDKNKDDDNDDQLDSIDKQMKTKLKKISLNYPSPFTEIMYIQMELCEKSTLQVAIYSQQLYLDNRRSRRLFRELIEALAYIHDKHIIHRDLKPGNVFLDSYDRVKIGDFGLATGYVNELLRVEHSSTQDTHAIVLPTATNSRSIVFDQKSEIVGTPFYIPPEVQARSQDLTSKKITYTQKVDIYSAGIIFFEMIYRTPATGMERFKLLMDLRLPEILFPDDVDNYMNDQEKCLIRQLLNHNPTERPTSAELLESEYLPPLEIEEAKQQVMIKQVIQNPRSKQHKFLLNTLFNRQMSSVDDIVYDSEGIDVVKSRKLINNEQLKARVFQFVSDRLKVILKKYGAIRFTVPTFTPAGSLKKFNLNHAFTVCDNNGTIVYSPYDLRIPFARYVARNQNLSSIPNFRRYAIDKVYRSRIVGYHPKELFECCFDIVTTQTANNWLIVPDVEVLLVLNEIIDSFECLKNKPFTLRVNSIKFLKAVFTFFEIDEQHFDSVLRILAESNDRNFVSKSNDSEYSKTPRDHINYMLSSKNILESNKINIMTQMLLENEKNTAKELIDLIQFYMRRKPNAKQKQAYDQAIDAIKELGLIIDCLQNSSNTFRMKIKFVPNLVLNLSNCNIYSRLIFQLQYDVVKKHQVLNSILATGGRYDDLIENFQINFSSKQDPINEKALMHSDRRTAVGFSLEIEKIVKCVIEDNEQIELETISDCDLILYADIYEDDRFRFTFKDLCQIAQELRAQGYRIKVFNEKLIKSLSDLNKFCMENLVKYLFILISINDQQRRNNQNLYQVKTLQFEKEKYIDRHSSNLMNAYEIIDYIKAELLTSNAAGNSYSSSPFSQFNFGSGVGGGGPLGNMGMGGNSNFTFESSSCSISSTSSNFTANYINTSNYKYQSPPDTSSSSYSSLSKIVSATNIQFIDVERTFEQLSKKKVVNLISASITNKLNNIVNNSTIEVLTLEIPFKILKLVVYESDFEKDGFGNIDDKIVEQSIKNTIDKVPKYRNQIKELIYRIVDLKRKRDQSIIILCSCNDLHDFKFVIMP